MGVLGLEEPLKGWYASASSGRWYARGSGGGGETVLEERARNDGKTMDRTTLEEDERVEGERVKTEQREEQERSPELVAVKRRRRQPRKQQPPITPSRYSSRSCTKALLPKNDSPPSAFHAAAVESRGLDPLSIEGDSSNSLRLVTSNSPSTSKSTSRVMIRALFDSELTVPKSLPSGALLDSPIRLNDNSATTPGFALGSARSALALGRNLVSSSLEESALQDPTTIDALSGLLELASSTTLRGLANGQDGDPAGLARMQSPVGLGIRFLESQKEMGTFSQQTHPPPPQESGTPQHHHLRPASNPTTSNSHLHLFSPLITPASVSIPPRNPISFPRQLSESSPPPPPTKIQFPQTPPTHFDSQSLPPAKLSTSLESEKTRAIISKVRFEGNVFVSPFVKVRVEDVEAAENGLGLNLGPQIEEAVSQGVEGSDVRIKTGSGSKVVGKGNRQQEPEFGRKESGGSTATSPPQVPSSGDALRFIPRKKKPRGKQQRGLHSWVEQATSPLAVPTPTSSSPPSQPRPTTPPTKPVIFHNRASTSSIPMATSSNSPAHDATSSQVLSDRSLIHRLRARLFPLPPQNSSPGFKSRRPTPHPSETYSTPEPLYSIEEFEANVGRLHDAGIDAPRVRDGSIRIALMDLCQKRPDLGRLADVNGKFDLMDTIRSIKLEGEEEIHRKRDAWQNNAARYLFRRYLGEWELRALERDDEDLWALIAHLAGVAWVNTTVRRMGVVQAGPEKVLMNGELEHEEGEVILGLGGRALMRIGERLVG